MHKLFNTAVLEALIPPSLDNQRLDQVLAQLFSHYSRNYLQQHIQEKRVQLNGQPVVKKNLKVLSGQQIQIQLILDRAIHEKWQAEPIPLNIIYEDEALLVVNKPAGLVTHPAPGHPNRTLVNALLNYFPSLESLPRAGIIHRLDKDTSGLLMVPKNLSSHTYLVKALAARQVKRHYLALVQGNLITSGQIKLPIGRHSIFRQKQAINLTQGKPAITHYAIAERFHNHTLLNVHLETGRTHQIRVHMAHLKHSIVGDPLYGNAAYTNPALKLSSNLDSPITLKENLQHFKRQALHARSLSILHPLTHHFLSWEAPLPTDMKNLLIALRINNNN